MHFDDENYDNTETLKNLTLGVEDVGSGFRWKISCKGKIYCAGFPLLPDMAAALKAGVAMLDLLQPKPIVRVTIKKNTVVKTVIPPPQQTGVGAIPLQQTTAYIAAINDMPTTTTAPMVRARLKPGIAKLASVRGWRCCYCGIALTGSTATIEHLLAKADGGGNKVENLEISCQTCNSERGRMPPDLYLIWRQRRGLVIREGALEDFKYKPD